MLQTSQLTLIQSRYTPETMLVTLFCKGDCHYVIIIIRLFVIQSELAMRVKLVGKLYYGIHKICNYMLQNMTR